MMPNPFASTTPGGAVDPFALHWSLHPRQYVAPKAPKPLQIDGNIDKPEWQSVPFSAPFDEIRGKDDAPNGTRPSSSCATRMKMMWDDDYLYIAALVESDFTVIANFTKRNEPIFQKDSDFEVFLNPSGNCHNYKELELNAINTVWNLMLDKPYDDNGHEHSARIADPGSPDYYEVYRQSTATRVVKGQVNDPNGKGATWAVELALAHSDVLAHDPSGQKPAIGTRWRINFSRVEHQGDINWTWQAQRIWDPVLKRVAGKVAMHLPDAWGYVEFAPSTSSDRIGDVESPLPTNRDPTWPARLAIMNVYYAQQHYKQAHDGIYASSLSQLQELVDPAILKPFLSTIRIALSANQKTYKASLKTPDGAFEATVTDDRLLTVEQIGNAAMSS